jgi:hypothetical protein
MRRKLQEAILQPPFAVKSGLVVAHIGNVLSTIRGNDLQSGAWRSIFVPDFL